MELVCLSKFPNMQELEKSDAIIKQMLFKLCIIQDDLHLYRERTANIVCKIEGMQLLEEQIGEDTLNSLEELHRLIAYTEDKVKEMRLDIGNLIFRSQKVLSGVNRL